MTNDPAAAGGLRTVPTRNEVCAALSRNRAGGSATIVVAAVAFTALAFAAGDSARAAPDDPVPAAKEMDASLKAVLDTAGAENPLRADLQRPVDRRLLTIRKLGLARCGLFHGKVHFAKDAAAVRALSGKLDPGDQLVLAAGEWKDATFTFEAKGSERAAILVRPETPGGVTFTGASSVIFHGEHLVVSDLEFRGCPVTRDGTVVFRLGLDDARLADRCIAHRIRIVGCNSADAADLPRFKVWQMTVRGHDDTVADCTFEDLRNIGQMLAASYLPPSGTLGLHVLDNRFAGRPKLDEQNGYEVLQIGWSGEKGGSAGALIQGNAFFDCNGENEIVTLKASDVYVRRNTFTRCQGTLSLRVADRVLVQENVFDGGGVANAGGVFSSGAGHVIVGNTFRDLRSPKNQYWWAMAFAAANVEALKDDPAGVARTRNVVVARNRFERTDSRIAVGTYPTAAFSLLPEGLRVVGNVFTGTAATSPFDWLAPDPTGAMTKSIVESGNRFEP